MFTLENTDEDPAEKGFERERATFAQLLIQLRVGQGRFGRHVFVQHQGKHREHCVDSSIAGKKIKEYLGKNKQVQ